ncbi:MAG TPA: hypothetical protein VD886_15035 [Herpetosiphonaceae bacterium]|nr:hypothetical protein [Herpetosiphonaceae bacterium]
MTPSFSHKRFGLTAFVILLILAPVIMRGAGAAPQVVSWGPPEIRSKSDSDTDTYSAIDTDGNGKIHMAWMEYGSTNAGRSTIYYTNNVNGSWLTPYAVTSTGARGGEPLLDMKVKGNEVHFLYINSDTFVVHRYLTLSGATPTPTGSTLAISGSQKGANPELVIDKDGRLHAIYISRLLGTEPNYQVIHRIWSGGPSWSFPVAVNPDGPLQKFPTAVATADGRIHLAFLSDPAGPNNETFRYYIYNGSWQRSTDIYSGKSKQIHLSTNGSTIFVLYTAEPNADGLHTLYFRQGGNGVWSQQVEMSAQGSFNTNPHGYYNDPLKTLFIFWASSPPGGLTSLMVREYTLGGATSTPVNLGGVDMQYPRATGSGASVSVIWQDKAPGTAYDIRMRTSGATPPPVTPTTGPSPTPQPTAVPTASAVDFTVNRTTGTPTKNPNVGVSLTNLLGNPTQMRYSQTPFAAGDATLPWQALQPAFTVNTTPGALVCRLDIFVQVRNGTNGQVSPVRSFGVIVDAAIQSLPNLYTMESVSGDQGVALADGEQPYAPNGGDPGYTRASIFAYSFGQEPGTCSGIKSYQVETYNMAPSPMPSLVDGFAPFNPFNANPDTNGIGYPEQTVIANLVLTDSLGTKAEFTKTIIFDDDPPVLSPGGSVSFPDGASTNITLVPLQITATVTDDGYTNSAPITQKYWGVWVVATKSQTLPEPKVFAQYGKVHKVEPGTGSVEGVNLTNSYNQESPTPAMRTAGPRYIHIRFIDGAGNYTNAGLTSPAITLNTPFVDGTKTYVPVVAK